MSDLDSCKADNHDSLTYTITDKMFKDTIMNLNSSPNVTKVNIAVIYYASLLNNQYDLH